MSVGTESRGVISDEEIVRRFQETGGTECFAELFERHRKRIYIACRGFFAEGGPAEDAVQETFLRAYQNIQRFHGGNFRGWLLRIARNVCVDIWRERQRVVLMTEAETEVSELLEIEALDHTSELRLAAEKVFREMQALSPDQRRCLELKIEGYSYEETATCMGLSIEAVKSHLQNARRMLWLRMERMLTQLK
jgi:RNA polymerase sigma-70 factor (ECF subfamily)